MALHHVTIFAEKTIMEGEDYPVKVPYPLDTFMFDYGELLTKERVLDLMDRIYTKGRIVDVHIVRE
jgi:hypothetical protein